MVSRDDDVEYSVTQSELGYVWPAHWMGINVDSFIRSNPSITAAASINASSVNDTYVKIVRAM